MSDRRPHINAKTDIAALLIQAELQGRPVLCSLCKEPLRYDQPRIREHMVPRALGGSDFPENLRWVHKKCADLKTRGAEGTSNKHSIANGDISRIRKADRLAAGGKVSRSPMKKDPKWKRTVDGRVVER